MLELRAALNNPAACFPHRPNRVRWAGRAPHHTVDIDSMVDIPGDGQPTSNPWKTTRRRATFRCVVVGLVGLIFLAIVAMLMLAYLRNTTWSDVVSPGSMHGANVAEYPCSIPWSHTCFNRNLCVGPGGTHRLSVYVHDATCSNRPSDVILADNATNVNGCTSLCQHAQESAVKVTDIAIQRCLCCIIFRSSIGKLDEATPHCHRRPFECVRPFMHDLSTFKSAVAPIMKSLHDWGGERVVLPQNVTMFSW